jgi:alanyl-tRNA synthetase
MMTSAEIRQAFMDFFQSKGHEIVPSAPIVIKNDPTLMFTNAGMNQFKDYFLGNKKAANPRVADTQKCLRVSGKHNDLEEVGVDTYHHTMFEMLGNWSFGDAGSKPGAGYFKKEAIAWSWELLTEVYKLDKDKLYVTVFAGDEKERLPKDDETFNEWKKYVAVDRILLFGRKDNFWEMGDTGPCGPCTEIHVDCRTDKERKQVAGKTLVNKDHPQVIEIWNNVFIQFNRLKDGSLEPLPAKHVDTGMGLERLVRVLQGKTSNYDTDIFTGTIAATEKITNKKYNLNLSESKNPPSEGREAVAFRVIADHIRAIAFTIADGQLPSNTGAGYVIRRILRRAVRYYYSYLDYKQPLLHQLLPGLAKQFESVFPELEQQLDFITKLVRREEEKFLKTLALGLRRFSTYADLRNSDNFVVVHPDEDLHTHISIKEKYQTERYRRIVAGEFAFELNDTFGFPIDLTELIAVENGFTLDKEGFEKALKKQKDRSRAASVLETGDWVILKDDSEIRFIGYESVEAEAEVIKYRKIKSKGKELCQIVLDTTPFYAEGGGQVGDTGTLFFEEVGETIQVVDTKRENDLIIHFTENLPNDLTGNVKTKIDTVRRNRIAAHHSATHLLHAALRQVLGSNVTQKGSLVNEEYLRFDFSYLNKMTDEEIKKVEEIVNEKIRENIKIDFKYMSKDEATAIGAMALFGEKYKDIVRVVIIDFDFSKELCGGTHVSITRELGLFKIISESSIAAGVRRIEAVCGVATEKYINEQLTILDSVKRLIKNPSDVAKGVEKVIDERDNIQKRLESIEASKSNEIVEFILKNSIHKHKDFSIISYSFECYSEEIFTRIFNIIRAKVKNSIIILGARIGDHERLRFFLNSKDNNYTLNISPLNLHDYVFEQMSNMILMKTGEVVLDAYGKFKSGIDEIVSILTDYIQNLLRTIDAVFPEEE